MGLFFKKKAKEKNEIGNKQLKETLANTALQMLKEEIEYDELLGTRCEFGYLFVIDGHGLEALFKITTDKGTFYFAAQQNSLMRLSIDEAYFEEATRVFLSLHQ